MNELMSKPEHSRRKERRKQEERRRPLVNDISKLMENLEENSPGNS